MNIVLRRIVLAVVLLMGVMDPLAQTAQACPMCKIANEQDSLLPQAYMYSILFMMGMMFTLGGSVGVGMYLLSRKENAALASLGQLDGTEVEPDTDGPLPGGLQPAAT